MSHHARPQDLALGDEATIRYGASCTNDQLLRQYGFTLQGNIWDRLPLPAAAGESLQRCVGGASWAAFMLHGSCWGAAWLALDNQHPAVASSTTPGCQWLHVPPSQARVQQQQVCNLQRSATSQSRPAPPA